MKEFVKISRSTKPSRARANNRAARTDLGPRATQLGPPYTPGQVPTKGRYQTVHIRELMHACACLRISDRSPECSVPVRHLGRWPRAPGTLCHLRRAPSQCLTVPLGWTKRTIRSALARHLGARTGAAGPGATPAAGRSRGPFCLAPPFLPLRRPRRARSVLPFALCLCHGPRLLGGLGYRYRVQASVCAMASCTLYLAFSVAIKRKPLGLPG